MVNIIMNSNRPSRVYYQSVTKGEEGGRGVEINKLFLVLDNRREAGGGGTNK
jgi:hypothetical protein